MKKEILLLTDLSADNQKIRKELERCAMEMNGNLNGFRLTDDKKVMYLFQFQNETKLENFKKMEMVKKYKLMEKA